MLIVSFFVILFMSTFKKYIYSDLKLKHINIHVSKSYNYSRRYMYIILSENQISE